ncbi:nuclear transport factor 2 family protein [Ramlibacter sp. AW1]|uniref:Nuclear transport factor 2 family protein n=1 Tax=Ramlibacter aurantiacus TaxID=2801330 RepID=A0A936ZVC3_9BURK|nr:nuclear transport factor 2 family protein [Ramlibacter aurantiacus]MBL0423281.1 nuclear transport factor 2 family protein [Ramlibacter aurantiacus]
MPRNKLQAANLEGNADEVEAAFYDALRRSDIEQLMACWADEDDIVCVHPGGPRVVGAMAIRATFEAMFASGSIRARPQQRRTVESVGCCVHHLIEQVEVLAPSGPREAWVIATNVYVKTAQGWRLVAHHASPGVPELQEVRAPVSQVLH